MRVVHGIVIVCGWVCLQHDVSNAIDYHPEWEFNSPIGELQPPWLQGSDYLTYNVTTGNLIYHVGADGRWSPPDIGSVSGLLDNSVQLQLVPLAPPPIFRDDDTFEGITMHGSNAVRIGFDRYLFWPWSPEDPQILQSQGLDRAPTSYDFGAILPMGLTQAFLQVDLFAITFPATAFELRVVPEPASIASLATFATLIGVRSTCAARKRAIANKSVQ